MSGLKRTTACVRAQLLEKTYLAEIEAMVAGSGFTKCEKIYETAEEVFVDDYVKSAKYLTTDNYFSVTKYINVRS